MLKRISSAFFILCCSSFLMVSNVFAFSFAGSAGETALLAAPADLEAAALTITVPLVSLWVIRKFFKLINGS